MGWYVSLTLSNREGVGGYSRRFWAVVRCSVDLVLIQWFKLTPSGQSSHWATPHESSLAAEHGHLSSAFVRNNKHDKTVLYWHCMRLSMLPQNLTYASLSSCLPARRRGTSHTNQCRRSPKNCDSSILFSGHKFLILSCLVRIAGNVFIRCCQQHLSSAYIKYGQRIPKWIRLQIDYQQLTRKDIHHLHLFQGLHLHSIHWRLYIVHFTPLAAALLR